MSNGTRGPSETDDLASYLVSGKAGDVVFREGESGTDMYVIQEGEIEILKTYGKAERRLAVLEPGDFFGEMSLLEDVPREATARAVTDFKLVRIDHSTFDQVVQENPEIAVRMLRKLCRRLREVQEAEVRAAKLPEEILERPEPAPPPAAKSSARAVLVHATSGKEFELPVEGECSIGRQDRVTGFTPDIDFTGLDGAKTLSRRHAKIARQGDDYYVREEIGTSNGTFVNGERLKTGVPVKLADGDEVHFGRLKTVFRYR